MFTNFPHLIPTASLKTSFFYTSRHYMGGRTQIWPHKSMKYNFLSLGEIIDDCSKHYMYTLRIYFKNYVVYPSISQDLTRKAESTLSIWNRGNLIKEVYYTANGDKPRLDGEAVPEIINSRETLLHLDWRNKKKRWASLVAQQ